MDYENCLVNTAVYVNTWCRQTQEDDDDMSLTRVTPDVITTDDLCCLHYDSQGQLAVIRLGWEGHTLYNHFYAVKKIIT